MAIKRQLPILSERLFTLSVHYDRDQKEHTIDHRLSPSSDRAASGGESRELALRIAELIAETPASDTRVIDIHRLSSVADYFVLCSGENERQLRAISREITEKLDEAGVQPDRVEGSAPSGWMLLDYGDVIVHIFGVGQRAFYRLEELWAEAPTLVAIQ